MAAFGSVGLFYTASACNVSLILWVEDILMIIRD